MAKKTATRTRTAPPCIGLHVVLVGTGRAARGIGGAFAGAGLTVAGLVSRGKRKVPGFTVLSGAAAKKALAKADLVVLAVPDAEIAATAASLAKGPGRLVTKIYVHLSGSQDSSLLEPLRRKGALTAALHPFFSFGEDAPPTLAAIPFSIEGSPEAVAILTRLLEPFGVRPAPIDPRFKAVYHAAAVFCSNFTVALQAAADDMLRMAGVKQDDALRMLSTLLASTTANVAARGPRDALTGPVARRDLDTIETHLEALSRHSPHLVPPYAVMTLLLARTQGHEKLGKPFVNGLHKLIAQYLSP